jgi:hypothetical protein
LEEGGVVIPAIAAVDLEAKAAELGDVRGLDEVAFGETDERDSCGDGLVATCSRLGSSPCGDLLDGMFDARTCRELTTGYGIEVLVLKLEAEGALGLEGEADLVVLEANQLEFGKERIEVELEEGVDAATREGEDGEGNAQDGAAPDGKAERIVCDVVVGREGNRDWSYRVAATGDLVLAAWGELNEFVSKIVGKVGELAVNGACHNEVHQSTAHFPWGDCLGRGSKRRLFSEREGLVLLKDLWKRLFLLASFLTVTS